jgi:hypothetical protein
MLVVLKPSSSPVKKLAARGNPRKNPQASEVHRQVAGSLDAAAVAFACHPWIDARGVDVIAALANHGRVARASD